MAALTAALAGLAIANTVGNLRKKAPGTDTGTGAGGVASMISDARAQVHAQSELPPVPNAAVDAQVADAERTRAEAAQRTRATGASVRRATLLTGASGITAAPPVLRKTLLGQ